MLAFLRTRFNLLSRLSLDRKASVAVEFALIAAPLVLMVCACVELGMIFLVSVTLDNATDMAARSIRTGSTTSGASSLAQFEQTICNNMGWLSASCPTALTADVRTYSSFPAVSSQASLVKSGAFNASDPAQYVTGAGSQIEMVRVYYDWPLFTPLLNTALSTLSNGDAVLTYQVVFRNEPF